MAKKPRTEGSPELAKALKTLLDYPSVGAQAAHRPMLVFDAIQFAVKAHDGQTRDGLDEPYVLHPIQVAKVAQICGLRPHAVAAAALHDVIEDCGVTHEDLEAAGFPAVTVSLVETLTKWWGKEATPDEVSANKLQYYGEMLNSPDAMAIKLLDRASNLADLQRTVAKFEANYQKVVRAAFMTSTVQSFKTDRDEYVTRARKYLGKTDREFRSLLSQCPNRAAVDYCLLAQANLQEFLATLED